MEAGTWLRSWSRQRTFPNAPTGQRYAGSAPRFPYIEAENARINFKQGNEKKPLSFLNSDLSISLAPGDDWEVHFRAQPVRTDLDLDLADTGVLRIDGTLHRAAWLGADAVEPQGGVERSAPGPVKPAHPGPRYWLARRA